MDYPLRRWNGRELLGHQRRSYRDCRTQERPLRRELHYRGEVRIVKELNIALVVGQIIMLLPCWVVDTKIQYAVMYVAVVAIMYSLLIWLQAKKKSLAVAATRLKIK